MLGGKHRLMIALLALLIASCVQDEQADSVQTESVPVVFSCMIEAEDMSTRADNGYEGDMDIERLHQTGFGIFASQSASWRSDMMYNQHVAFTFIGDDVPGKGFWSYSPLKFWPTNTSKAKFCAYAPYVATPTADSETTGIIGMSPNDLDDKPYIDYRWAPLPEDNVDLLWFNKSNMAKPTAIDVKMRHALARLQLSIILDNSSSIVLRDGETVKKKVLIKHIALSGTLVTEGRIDLSQSIDDGGGHIIPAWETRTAEARTIHIDHDDEYVGTYGVVDNAIRFVDGYPFRWQPAGLQKNTTTNALSIVERIGYIYLIPTEADATLSLTCQVTYCVVFDDDRTPVTVTKTTTLTPSPVPITFSPLKGNTTYHVKLNLNIPEPS